MISIGLVIVAGLGVGALAAGVFRGDPEVAPTPESINEVFIPSTATEVGVPAGEAGCSDVESPEVQDPYVVQVDEKHDPYTSTPATSGAHYAGPLSPAIYWIEHDPEAIVANLAQGDIVMYHNGYDKREEQDVIKGLFVYFASEEIMAVPGDHLNLDGEIVLTSWGKIQTCEKLSGEAVEQFFFENRGRAPGLAVAELPADS
jgi:hypothetical protein